MQHFGVKFMIITAVSLATSRHLDAGPNAPSLWQPRDMTRNDWLKYHGMSANKWYQTRQKYLEVLRLHAEHTGNPRDMMEVNIPPDVGQDLLRYGDGILLGCVLMTSEQLDEMIVSMEGSHAYDGTHKRSKRKIINFQDSPTYTQWGTLIFYKFDGTHTTDEQAMIRESLEIWSNTTCLRFMRLHAAAAMTDPHVIFTSQKGRCYTFTGQTGVVEQPVVLGSDCFHQRGNIIHEIGHLLGLVHEHQRPDRDSYIRILPNNINYMRHQFLKNPITVSYEMPYDTTSIMHYTSTDGSYFASRTIETLNPTFQYNIGQRVELSFYDIKTINMAYCYDNCSPSNTENCANGGYQDPTNCNKCLCPDGFTGDTCRELQLTADCGGDVILSDGVARVISSPGYDDLGYYKNGDQCTWRFTAGSNFKVKFRFQDEFSLYVFGLESCYHWIELRTGADLSLPGARFCGFNKPEQTIVSEQQHLLVLFRSRYQAPYRSSRRGFKATVWAVSADNLEAEPNFYDAFPQRPPPLGGQYSWSPWSLCHGHDCACGGYAVRTRSRVCAAEEEDNSENCAAVHPARQIESCDYICSAQDRYSSKTPPLISLPCSKCKVGYQVDHRQETCRKKIEGLRS